MPFQSRATALQPWDGSAKQSCAKFVFVEFPLAQPGDTSSAREVRRTTRRALAFLFLAMLFPLASAEAGGAESDFLARIVGAVEHKAAFFACFVHRYDAAHLAAHPKHRVTFPKALIDDYYRRSSVSPSNGGYSYQVSLAFRFRDRPETLTQIAEGGDGKPMDLLRGGATCARSARARSISPSTGATFSF
jgi:hypothetical protein